jgi:hypothetical protein
MDQTNFSHALFNISTILDVVVLGNEEDIESSDLNFQPKLISWSGSEILVALNFDHPILIS